MFIRGLPIYTSRVIKSRSPLLAGLFGLIVEPYCDISFPFWFSGHSPRVEWEGLEPSTSALQGQRSPVLSYFTPSLEPGT